MAHENFKFKLDLTDTSNWQPLLGSQDFGTFYMIYIKINKVEDVQDSQNIDCDFCLQNFRGQITIGFAQKPELNIPDEGDTEEQIDAYLNLSVEPFSLNHEIKNHTLKPKNRLVSDMVLATNIDVDIPNNTLYDPKRPDKSKYLDPSSFWRDGENYTQLSTRKYKIGSDDQDDFQEPDRTNKGMLGRVGPCIPNRTLVL
ncbi:hypothetical protein [Leeuwenhoekiella sp. H156]|uniref:hypothetical protein n=1 Tax=Leeuwenhoekiella sp. H156 TaxID=3450128 RepID=UPI003FA4C16D